MAFSLVKCNTKQMQCEDASYIRISGKRLLARPVDTDLVHHTVGIPVLQEIHHQIRDVFRNHQAAGIQVRAGLFDHLRIDAAGADDVHAHIILVELVGNHFGESVEGMLAGCIGGLVRIALVSHHGTDIDDGAERDGISV